MWHFIEGFAAALVVIGACVTFAPIIWLLCGGSWDGRGGRRK